MAVGGTSVLAALSAAPAALTESSVAATTSGSFLQSAAFASFMKVAPPLAAQAVFLAPMDTMKKIKAEGTTGDLPLIGYAMMLLNGTLWMTYGHLVGELTILLPNITALVCASYYCYTFNQYKPASFNMTPYLVGLPLGCAAIVGTAATMDLALAQNVLGIAGNVIVVGMFAGPLAAMKTVMEKKSTASLPFAMTCASFINCILWTGYGLMINDPYIWFGNVLGLGSSIVQLGLFAKFGFAKPTAEAKTD